MRNRGFTCGTGGTAVHQTRYITREPAIPCLGLLIRTWTRYSEPGQPRPHAEQRVNMRNSGFTCGTGAQPYTRPTTSHVDPLFRTRAISSAREPAIPSLGNPAHMQNSGLTCGTAGLRAEQEAQPYTRPTTSHANPLFRTRASSSAREPAIPSLGNLAHMRNSGLTCGTGGLRAEQQRAVPHGAARLACLRAAHEHCGTARQRRRSAAESPGVMSLARATRSAAGSA